LDALSLLTDSTTSSFDYFEQESRLLEVEISLKNVDRILVTKMNGLCGADLLKNNFHRPKHDIQILD
jgi:hypothetical protein